MHFIKELFNTDLSKEIHINLMHGITNANYDLDLDDKVLINIRPYAKSRYENEPDYSFNEIYWITLILHEFAHSIINDKMNEHNALIESIDKNPYKKILKDLYYGDSLETFIIENIIRALECLYVKRNYPDKFDDYIKEEYEGGYIKIYEVLDRLSSKNNIIDFVDIINLF